MPLTMPAVAAAAVAVAVAASASASASESAGDKWGEGPSGGCCSGRGPTHQHLVGVRRPAAAAVGPGGLRAERHGGLQHVWGRVAGGASGGARAHGGKGRGRGFRV